MKKALRIGIECGEKTCTNEEKKYCIFFRGRHPNTYIIDRSYCMVFGDLNKEAWSILRHPDCIKSTE